MDMITILKLVVKEFMERYGPGSLDGEQRLTLVTW
jgi:hypothetical protein